MNLENQMKMQTRLKCVYCVVFCSVIIATASVLPAAQTKNINGKDQKSIDAISAATTALGGEKSIDSVKSLIMTGKLEFLSNGSEQNIEIKILLPDNYLSIGTGRNSVSYRGISNNRAFNIAFFGAEKVNMPLIRREEETNRFVVMLLGLLFKCGPVAPLTLSSVADAADKFSISKEDGILGEIEFDFKEKYPLLINYRDVVSTIMPKTTVKPKTNKIVNFATEFHTVSETVDAVVRFEDRTKVDGIMFPKTIVFESRGEADTKIRLEKIQINPKLTIDDFEVPPQ